MRLTKENIYKYLTIHNGLDLHYNKKITHIDYISNDIRDIDISGSDIEEITCELPDGLESFYCNNSNLKLLPLLPKSLECFDGSDTKLPKEFQTRIWDDNIQCNNLRKLQMINSI